MALAPLKKSLCCNNCLLSWKHKTTWKNYKLEGPFSCKVPAECSVGCRRTARGRLMDAALPTKSNQRQIGRETNIIAFTLAGSAVASVVCFFFPPSLQRLLVVVTVVIWVAAAFWGSPASLDPWHRQHISSTRPLRHCKSKAGPASHWGVSDTAQLRSGGVVR